MDSKEERIVGQVDLIIFENPRNYYKVVSLKVDPESSSLFLDDHLTITGQMASLQEDTTYEFYGFVTNHPKYGQQFQVSRYQQVRPSSEEGDTVVPQFLCYNIPIILITIFAAIWMS